LAGYAADPTEVLDMSDTVAGQYGVKNDDIEQESIRQKVDQALQAHSKSLFRNKLS